MTARWAVEKVAPHRDIHIEWEPISLLFKNDPAPGSPYHTRARFGHGLLRVMESVRSTGGNSEVQRAYWEFATRIHHDEDRAFDPATALTAAGLDGAHATAFNDDSFDGVIRERMDVGLGLAGTDIGTPIIAFNDAEGTRVGIFGPVITRVPDHDLSLQLWDGMVAVSTVPGFWELKRTRTEDPEFGDRPA